jgi:uncharacterized protein YycO
MENARVSEDGLLSSTSKRHKWAAIGLIMLGLGLLTASGTHGLTQQDAAQPPAAIQSGDIIFQTSGSGQSEAIQLATNSVYSHMGIIYENNGEYQVYEAVQPVKLTPLREWIKRGENGHYVIKRLKDAETILTPEVLKAMKKAGEPYMGKPYDLYFEWSDDKIYCSELVWKIYQQATGLEIGQLEQLSDFDLSSEVVKSLMKERYGNRIPLNEKVISPGAMFRSELLVTVSSLTPPE